MLSELSVCCRREELFFLPRLGVDKHTAVCYNVVKGKIEGGTGGRLGIDVHEKRRLAGTADHNPNSPADSSEWRTVYGTDGSISFLLYQRLMP